QERAHRITVSGAIVDHACTLLAGLRSGFSFERIAALAPEIVPTPKVLAAVLKTAGLVDAQSFPHPENARRFLEEPRSEALSRLGRAWLSSDTFNDLRMIPHLEAEGGWQNQPEPARQKVLSMLNEVPPEKWWHLPSFIDAVNRHHPDFQRPAGDYDSWYIKDARTGAYLRGFHHWQDVEGELIRWMVTAPLHWFSAVDLAAPAAGSPAAAFRLTSLFELLLSGRAFPEVPPEESELHIDSKGQLALPSGFPRDARYQIARFCDWEPPRKGAYRYRLTPAALERARAQELTVKQLIALLRKHSAAKIPPNILSALKRWDSHGAQARLEQVVILRLSAPAILKALQSSRVARFLGDPIGPAAVLVKPGAQQNVLDALAELGYLGQADLASGEPIGD
ncbi:MAG: helicase-associated domain-containing protein, partial [Anaerolineae bacterium]|nr:helicase-associated domain-containing protein [Anaerolineae bacterium]